MEPNSVLELCLVLGALMGAILYHGCVVRPLRRELRSLKETLTTSPTDLGIATTRSVKVQVDTATFDLNTKVQETVASYLTNLTTSSSQQALTTGIVALIGQLLADPTSPLFNQLVEQIGRSTKLSLWSYLPDNLKTTLTLQAMNALEEQVMDDWELQEEELDVISDIITTNLQTWVTGELQNSEGVLSAKLAKNVAKLLLRTHAGVLESCLDEQDQMLQEQLPREVRRIVTDLFAPTESPVRNQLTRAIVEHVMDLL